MVRQQPEITERCTRTRVQEVPRHLIRIERRQISRELGAALEALIHIQDAAATPSFIPASRTIFIMRKRPSQLRVVTISGGATVRGSRVLNYCGAHPSP